jgi:multiple sugar transport system ATP-binding protein
MTVRRNIEFPLRSRRVPAAEREALVTDAAHSLGLEDLLDRKPAQLSGGQRQRVALARAIVRRPQAFLMDEPLSNLDAKLRVQTRAELIELRRRLQATFVYVTHDQIEAMTMADRIAIMHEGVLQQVGPPQEVYDRPANLFVARFIGSPPMNTLTGSVVEGEGGVAMQVSTATIPIPTPLDDGVRAAGSRALTLGVRPEHLVLGEAGVLGATVSVVESLGYERHVICRLSDGQPIIARISAELPVPPEGSSVHLSAQPEHLHLFDSDTGARVA